MNHLKIFLLCLTYTVIGRGDSRNFSITSPVESSIMEDRAKRYFNIRKSQVMELKKLVNKMKPHVEIKSLDKNICVHYMLLEKSEMTLVVAWSEKHKKIFYVSTALTKNFDKVHTTYGDYIAYIPLDNGKLLLWILGSSEAYILDENILCTISPENTVSDVYGAIDLTSESAKKLIRPFKVIQSNDLISIYWKSKKLVMRKSPYYFWE